MVFSLYVLFEALAAVYCLHCLYAEKIRFDFATIGIVLAEVAWMQLIYFNDWNYNLSWLIYPFIALYCGIKFGFNIKAIFINNILWITLISALQATIMIFLSITLGMKSVGEKESLLINISVFIILLLFLRKTRIDYWSKTLQSNERIIIVSLMIIVLAVIYFFINYKADKGMDILYYAILFISLMLIGIAVIDIGKHKVRAKEAEAELRLHKLYEKSFESLIEDIRARQHEFDNHINTIYSQHYLHQTYDELVEVQKKYCKSIMKLNHYNKLLSKGNSIVLGMLYSKFSEAEKRGIEVEYKIRIGDMKSEVPIYKVVELLGNILTNAIEALVACEETNRLKVVMLEHPHEIAIDISNECKNIKLEHIQKFFVKGYSEKGNNRGYGLYNVKKICDEYDILLETTIKKEERADMLHFMLIINKPL